ncbi:MAG: hypothetical protein WDM92_10285 [Caulobacteraceae bacterium]
MANSTVDVSCNSNLALSTTNTATNGMTAGGGASLNSGYGGGKYGGAQAGTNGGQAGASADFAVANVLTANAGDGAGVASTATTTIGNSDLAVTTGAATVDHSSVTFAGNSGSAQSDGRSRHQQPEARSGGLAFGHGGPDPTTRAPPRLRPRPARPRSPTRSRTRPPSADRHHRQTCRARSPTATSPPAALPPPASACRAPAKSDAGAIIVSAGGPGGPLADYSLANLQTSNGLLTATDTATFSQSETIPVITAAAATSGSTITVSGNIAQAAAEAEHRDQHPDDRRDRRGDDAAGRGSRRDGAPWRPNSRRW